MGGEPVRDAAAIGGLVEPRQRRQHLADAARIPLLPRRVFRAQPVSFHLVVAAVLQEKGLQAHVGHA